MYKKYSLPLVVGHFVEVVEGCEIVEARSGSEPTRGLITVGYTASTRGVFGDQSAKAERQNSGDAVLAGDQRGASATGCSVPLE